MEQEKYRNYIESAREYAQVYHTAEMFNGFTEEKVAKGVLVIFILMGEAVKTSHGEPLSMSKGYKGYLEQLLKGAEVLGDDWEQTVQVCEILTHALKPKNGDTR